MLSSLADKSLIPPVGDKHYSSHSLSACDNAFLWFNPMLAFITTAANYTTLYIRGQTWKF